MESLNLPLVPIVESLNLPLVPTVESPKFSLVPPVESQKLPMAMSKLRDLWFPRIDIETIDRHMMRMTITRYPERVTITLPENLITRD